MTCRENISLANIANRDLHWEGSALPVPTFKSLSGCFCLCFSGGQYELCGPVAGDSPGTV